MGQRVLAQVRTASAALADCDIAKARQVIDERRAIRDLDIDSLEANARLYAIHQPVASDLRLVLTLSRAVYMLLGAHIGVLVFLVLLKVKTPLAMTVAGKITACSRQFAVRID